jgi:hypothetical protein
MKNLIKSIKILKKLTGSVQFWFYKPETEKTESNRTQTEPNRKNQVKSSQTEKTKLSQFEPVFVTKSKPVGLNRFRFFF